MQEKFHTHNEDQTNFIKNHMPNRFTFEETSLLFSLLSDATRLQLFWILCHSEECVYNLAALLSISAPLVSFHLRFLKQNKLAVSHRQGKEVHYSLAATDEAKTLKEAVEAILCARSHTASE